MFERKQTRPVQVGSLKIGGGAPISVQTMVKCDTRDVTEVLRQCHEAAEAGADLIRIAAPTREAAEAFKEIVPKSPLPVVADIHFDYRLALMVLESGIQKLRINPGNIGERSRVEQVVRACQERQVPIRIGVNAGSLEPRILDKYGYPTADGMVESALGHVAILEELGFYDTIISIKASDVPMMIEAYRKLSQRVDYPLHVGVTEAGTPYAGTIKSAVGIGTVLAEGIGDTIRISLSGPITDEVKAGYEILKALELRHRGVNIVACPSCGRVEIDLVKIANEVEARLSHIQIDEPLKVAVMGCRVNGPGEAAGADVALFGGRGSGMLYIDGEQVRKMNEAEMVDVLVAEVEQMVAEKTKR